jgi:1,4-alpha-glucan branching enzyme
MVSRPVHLGGLGFGLKWDMGWMHDTLRYFSRDPVHRKYHHDDVTFRSLYAFHENFVLPLSHDEVVHGKGSLWERMPGDAWQKVANMRLLFAAMYAQPGKKLLFMGAEIAQAWEWRYDAAVDWPALADPARAGLQRLVADLNLLYREQPALHERDCDPNGFEWVEANDAEQSVFAFLRRARDPRDEVLVVLNATPVPRHTYRVGVSRGGTWREILNTDAGAYAGSGVGNLGSVSAEATSWHARPWSLRLTLPPLGALFLKPA